MAELGVNSSSVTTVGKAAMGRVAIVGAGPGDPELLTLRAARYLQLADCVLYDAMVNPEILALLRPRATRVPVGEYGMSRRQMDELIVARARRGAFVVRLTEEDLFRYGSDGEYWQAMKAAGVPVEVVPGVWRGEGMARTA